MPDNHRTNIGISLLCIHHCITRGLANSIQHCQGFQKSGFPDEGTQSGFYSYVRCLGTVVHAHHLSEDDVAFPFFKEVIPQAPFNAFAETHRQIVPILNEINLTLDKPGEHAGRLAELSKEMSGLNSLWHPHIQLEENFFTPQKVDELVSYEDQQKLAMQIGQHNQKNATPDYLIVPFTLFNLEGDERRYMAEEMPPVVSQQLVPQVWKEKWAPMLPFLLP